MTKTNPRLSQCPSAAVRSRCIYRIQMLKGNKLCMTDHILKLSSDAPPEVINRAIHFLENALLIAKINQGRDD